MGIRVRWCALLALHRKDQPGSHCEMLLRLCIKSQQVNIIYPLISSMINTCFLLLCSYFHNKTNLLKFKLWNFRTYLFKLYRYIAPQSFLTQRFKLYSDVNGHNNDSVGYTLSQAFYSTYVFRPTYRILNKIR